MNVLDRETDLPGLRAECGASLVRDSVVFLPAGGSDELMGERGTSATDGLSTPAPR